MARDRLRMGVALMALTLSIMWAGRHLPPNPIQFPRLISTSLSSDSPSSIQSTVAAKLDGIPRIKHIGRGHRCGRKSVSRTISIRIPSAPTVPAAPSMPSVVSTPGSF